MAAEASESKVISIKIEFSGGAELLFGNEKRIHVTLPLKNDDWNLRDLIEWLKINHLKERPELFVQNDTVRPGILVLVNDTDWELLVKPLMKYLKSEHYMYINDDTVAKTVMKHLSDNLSTEKSIIFEASPGIGILTEKLLENGARRVRVFENNEKHLGILKKLSIKYPKQLDVCNQQILSLPSLTYKYWETDEQSIKNLFIAVPKHLWNDVPTIKFVSVLSPIMATRFLRFILRQLVLKSYFFTDGRTQFLLFFSGTEHTYMFAKHSENFLYYRAVTVLYNTLFHIESLETVPWNCFQPNVIHQKIKKMQFDRNNACLVRLTPKTILDQFSPELLCDYYYFVSQTFMRRKNWIIPFLEKWFPNCGPQLIKKGIPVFKYFGDLSPQEVFDLFIHCTNLPEYSSSIFKAASKSAMTSYQKVEFDDESECSDSDNDGEINDQTEEKT